MLEDFYENNSYEVYKSTAEDRSEWKKHEKESACIADNYRSSSSVERGGSVAYW